MRWRPAHWIGLVAARRCSAIASVDRPTHRLVSRLRVVCISRRAIGVPGNAPTQEYREYSGGATPPGTLRAAAICTGFLRRDASGLPVRSEVQHARNSPGGRRSRRRPLKRAAAIDSALSRRRRAAPPSADSSFGSSAATQSHRDPGEEPPPLPLQPVRATSATLSAGGRSARAAVAAQARDPIRPRLPGGDAGHRADDPAGSTRR